MDAGHAARESDFFSGDLLMTTLAPSRAPSAHTVIEMPEALFRSAHAALVFALNYSMHQYDRPLISRVAGGPAKQNGRGLSGLDGAGQAGMIRAELARLPLLHQAVLVASFAPQQVPCGCSANCCRGWKTNAEWATAISELTTFAASAALSGCLSNARLRSALLQRLLGAKVTLVNLAECHGVDEKTAAAHSAKIKRWLFGGGEGLPGEHQQALRAFSARMSKSGLIQDER